MSDYKPKVLIVDDEAQILRVMSATLIARGYEVRVAPNALEAIELFEQKTPDLIILDLVMPGLSGFDFCKMIRKVSQVPIIILSARGLETDTTTALELGANDYITKPFRLNDLLIRMRVALRRTNNVEIEIGILSFGDINVNLSSKTVLVGGREAKLTTKEYDVLIYLMNNAGKLITRQNLMHRLFGSLQTEQTEQLRILINQLRNKIEPNPEKPSYILTQPGLGYKFCELSYSAEHSA